MTPSSDNPGRDGDLDMTTESLDDRPRGLRWIDRLVRVVFLLLEWAGLTLIALGLAWVWQYAAGEWSGDLGRWDYWKENLWLSIKGPVALFAGLVIAIVGWSGWIVIPNTKLSGQAGGKD